MTMETWEVYIVLGFLAAIYYASSMYAGRQDKRAREEIHRRMQGFYWQRLHKEKEN